VSLSLVDQLSRNRFSDDIGQTIRPDFGVRQHVAFIVEIINRQKQPSPVPLRQGNFAGEPGVA
jgi:hypothetical protein